MMYFWPEEAAENVPLWHLDDLGQERRFRLQESAELNFHLINEFQLN